MPKVSDEHREYRQRQIVAAALRCFADKGFHRTSMSDIIAASELSAGAIYGHFTSKADLVAGATAEVFAKNATALAATRGPGGEPVHPLVFTAGISESMIGKEGASILPLQVWGEAALDDDVRHVFDVVSGRLQTGVRSQIVLWLTEVKHLSMEEANHHADTLTPVTCGLLQGAVVQGGLVLGFDRDAYFGAAHPLFDTIQDTRST